MLGNCVYKTRLRNYVDNGFSLWAEAYNTRQSTLQLLHVPRALSSYSEQSVDISGPRIYNAIPVDVRCNEQYDSFKYKYKKNICYLY